MSLIVYGGTFDPLHLAHLRLAWEALEQLDCAELRFLPSAQPPHRAQPGASATQRAEWIARAIAEVPGFVLDTRELERQGPSYSIDTVIELRRELDPQRCLIWLIGEDALHGLPSWHHADRLFDYCNFAVLRRPGTVDRTALQQRHQQQLVPAEQLPDYANGRIAWLDNSLIEFSASEVRRRLAAGLSARYLLDERIREEIEVSGTYRPHGGAGV